MNAKELITARTKRAAELRQWKSEARAALGKLTARTLARAMKGWGPKLPPADPSRLLALAESLRGFSQSRWASHDTEYYSADGYDDYQSDRREAAAEEAEEMSELAAQLVALRGS